EGPPPRDADRLEEAVALAETGRVPGNADLARRDDPAVDEGERRAHPRSREARSGAAFETDSRNSSSGTESATIPQPTLKIASPARRTIVRIRIDESRPPARSHARSDPIPNLRLRGSSSSRISIARIFG